MHNVSIPEMNKEDELQCENQNEQKIKRWKKIQNKNCAEIVYIINIKVNINFWDFDKIKFT